MNYDLNEEQTILKDTARKFLKEICTGDYLREMKNCNKGYTDELWEKVANMGWIGVLIPEEYNGVGGSFLDMSIVLYEMGYCCLPGPFFSTAISGTLAILEAGGDEHKKEILPKVASGELKLALAWLEDEGINTADGIHLKADPYGEGYILNGKKLFVNNGHVADKIICVCRTRPGMSENNISMFIIDSKAHGLQVNPLHAYTGEKLSEILFEQVHVPKESLMGEINQGWPVFKDVFLKCAVLKSAEMSGGSERVLQLASDYAKERIQFGRPIGAFQAIQHHCANMFTEHDTSKYLTYLASWLINENMNYSMAAMMCKSYVSDSYRRLLKIGAQVLGGTGFCEEHDFHLYCQKGRAAELDFGDAELHREWLAEEMEL